MMAARTKGIRETILAAGSAASRKAIEVPEWGVTVYVHEMSVREAEEFAGVAADVEQEGDKAVTRHLTRIVEILMLKLRDEDGARVFHEEDRGFLLDQPIRVISRIATEAMDAGEPEGEAKNG